MTTPTRQRLTEAAARRFYRDGFRNVGIDQVLADVGISKTAFYKHFESKDDLLLAAVDQVVSSSEYQGCIFVNASIEFPLLHEPAHVAAAGHKRAIEEIVY